MSLLSSLLKRIDPWLKLSQFTYKVPFHSHSVFYSLGAMAIVGFLLMIITGLVLAQLYDPNPEVAYESLQQIEKMGWASVIRAIHYWIAQGVIAAMLLHIARVFITGAYQHPRQVTWWIGIALFATMLMGSYMSGTILKWDEEGLDALAHYKEALRNLGPIGTLMTESLPGSSKMNFRIFTSHIAVFPILIIFLAAIHLYLVHTFNFSPTPKDEWADQPNIPEEAMTARFDEHALRIFIYSGLYYGGLIALAFFVRAPLAGPPTPEHGALKPPWPYLWMYGFENIWGVVAVLFCSLFLFGFLALVPLLDRKQDRRYRARKPILVMGGIVAFALIALSIHGKVTPAQDHGTHSHGEGEGHEGDHHGEEAPTNPASGHEEGDHKGTSTTNGGTPPAGGHSHADDTKEHSHEEKTHEATSATNGSGNTPAPASGHSHADDTKEHSHGNEPDNH